MTWWWVCLGAAAGAPLRYLTDRAVQRRLGAGLPWGTLVVNVAGSLLLGLVTGVAGQQTGDGALVAGVGIGLCGAFTTYSTFAYETWQLVEDGAAASAALNVLVSVLAGVAAAALGLVIGQLL
ncbi:MAG: fluoride efflux transporter CrcB [Nocardioidaceae bacterium]|nr:fluoride efflux transporter CrcB [Nocardioidaceae bacterium]MDQ3324969.1 fluoride efflux transporter CrcB [Actinomycetota bacterium]MDQ3415548.1 fluoride efflux transporter CrcB [Actinomycetota bacterium]